MLFRSETEVIEAFEEIFTSTHGKLIVATFSSSIYRMQVLVDLAAQFERKVAFVGRSMVQNTEIAQRLGFLRVPSGVQIRDVDVPNYAAQDVLCLTTGSQGEPQAALPRIAIDDHRHVKLTEDDTVVLSARAIPGNEKAIARTMSHIARRGADVVTDRMKHVHVSGHASAEELKLLISLVRPRYFVPIHGEYRQLAQHARLAERVMKGHSPRLQVLLAQDGDTLQFDRHGARIGDKAPTGRILIDITRVGEVGDEVLRDRRHLAGDGVVVAVIAIGLALRLLGRNRPDPEVTVDLPGSLLSVAGLVCVVYGLSRAETDGWTATATLGFIAAGVVLLGVFAVVESRVADPLLDRKSTRLNSSHTDISRMPSSA